MANGTAAYAQLVARWERAKKQAEPGHGETFDSVLSQSVAVISQLKKGVYAPRQGERVSETRLQAAGTSQTAYDNMHSAGVDILDWEPSPQPNGSPSRATSMRRGELTRTNTRNAVLAAVAIFTPRSAAASPRSRNLTSDNGKGSSFRSSGVLAASGVAPPPAGAGQGGKAAAGASPARGSTTRIGKLDQQQQGAASPRPRPPGGAASGEATTPRRVRLALAQLPAGDGEEGDEGGLGAALGADAGGGSCAPTSRSKASSRPSFNSTNRMSNNGTNRLSNNGMNRGSYNGSTRGSFNGAPSCASSVYGGPDRDSGGSNYEYDSYDDDGVDTDACSHVSRAASRNSRTSARSRATTNSLGAFSDFDTDEECGWTPHQGGAMISPALLRGRTKAKARAMSRADEAIIGLALTAYEPGEARHSLMVPQGGVGGTAGAGEGTGPGPGAASGASQLFDRRKLRVAVPPGEVPLAPVPRAVPAHVAHGLHAPTSVVLAAAEHGLLGTESSPRVTSFTSGAPSPLASPGACRDISPSMAANPCAQRSRLADAAPNHLRHSWAPGTASPDSSPPSPGNSNPGGTRQLKARGGRSFAPSQAATTATAARAQARAQLPELPPTLTHSGGPGGVQGSGGSFTAKRASLGTSVLTHTGGQPEGGGGGGGGEHARVVGSCDGAAGPGSPGVRSSGSVLLPRAQASRMAAPVEDTGGLPASCTQLSSPGTHSRGAGAGSCHPEAAAWPHSPGHGGLPSPGGTARHAAGPYSMGCPLRPGGAAAVSPVRGRTSGGGGVAGSGGSFTAHALSYTDGVQRSGGSSSSTASGLIRGYAGAGHGLDYRNFDAVPRLGFDTARIRPQQHGNMGGGAAAATAHARHSAEQVLPAAGPDVLRRSLVAAPAGLAPARAVDRPGTAADGPLGAAGARQGQGSGAEASPGRFARARRQSCADAGMLMGPQASGPSGMLLTREQVDRGLRAHGGAGAGAGGEGGKRQVVLSVIGKRGSVSGPLVG